MRQFVGESVPTVAEQVYLHRLMVMPDDEIDIMKKKFNDGIPFEYIVREFSKDNEEVVRRGGEIGWIKETLLSEELNNILIKLKKGDITQPLKYPNGYLILKLNDKKEMKQIIDIDKELEEIIRFEKNRQLNQFSLLFYKKLKQNSKINEYSVYNYCFR